MKIGFILLTSITAFNNYVDAIIAVNRINSTKVATELFFSTEHIKFKFFLLYHHENKSLPFRINRYGFTKCYFCHAASQYSLVTLVFLDIAYAISTT
ncbi:MAG: hypothetical protein ACI9YE_000254 [Psychroserpens sp.]|jgi:hypothetical protein